MTAILRIALPLPLPALFDYLAPAAGTPRPGQRVTVPFGRGRRVGLVIAQTDRASVPRDRLRRIERVLDDEPILDAELLRTLAWASEYWRGAPGEVYFAAVPAALRRDRALPATGSEAWTLAAPGRDALAAGTRRGGSRALLQALEPGIRRAHELDAMLPGWRPAARRLQKAGLVECVETSDNDAAPMAGTAAAGTTAPHLGGEQQQAVESINAASGFRAFLLDGVTGSGKTEVYLAVIRRMLSAGRQSLLLVPEIGLAPQAVQRLQQRLGVPIEVLHSNLADGARARAWLRARSGEARVIVGTRSAIFTPLPQPGVIIVDEEHDTSYKQQDGFRYHARDLAVMRAQRLDVPVLLGSATPSLESLANVEAGRYTRLRLSTRPLARPPPTVSVLDMRGQRLAHGLSPALLAAIEACLERDEQVLVFRNRRGYAPVLMCHECGWHAECDRCDKPMTLHRRAGRIACHHCGREQPAPRRCPECGHADLDTQGHGTERLEEALAQRFPDVPLLRVDRETTRTRDSFARLLGRLSDDRAAILIGTQMLAKGHDLPNLTLVAITGVDEGLHSVDFRAGERLAQLIVQVAGRAGRAAKPGRVILQTHYPEHPLLLELLTHGYSALAQSLLAERRVTGLPPHAHQALLRAEASRETAVEHFLAAAIALLSNTHGEVDINGPMPAPMPRRAGRHRAQVLLESPQRAALQKTLAQWHPKLFDLKQARKVRWSLDVDPVDLY